MTVITCIHMTGIPALLFEIMRLEEPSIN